MVKDAPCCDVDGAGSGVISWCQECVQWLESLWKIIKWDYYKLYVYLMCMYFFTSPSSRATCRFPHNSQLSPITRQLYHKRMVKADCHAMCFHIFSSCWIWGIFPNFSCCFWHFTLTHSSKLTRNWEMSLKCYKLIQDLNSSLQPELLRVNLPDCWLLFRWLHVLHNMVCLC